MAPCADLPLIVRAVRAGGFLRVNAAFREKVEFSDAELAAKPFLDWLDPADHTLVSSVLEGDTASCRAGHRTRNGNWLPLNITTSGQGPDAIVLARCVAALDPSELGRESRNEDTVLGSLNTIARIVEEQNPGYKCSILLVADGLFVSGAGPSLPDDYNHAIDGYAIGPTVGSCGTAIYWNVPIMVEDIQADPLWALLADLAEAAGVAACWSHPFTSKNGRVLGALALYSPEPRAPTLEQLSRLRAAAQMTGLAVERGRAEEALREQRLREMELERQLRTSQRMKAIGSLAGGVAHDFNNLLTSIISYASLARDTLPPEAQSRLDIGEVLAAADRAAGLTNQLLAFSRQQPVELQKLDLGSSLLAMERLLERTIGEDIKLTVTPPKETVHIWADTTMFDQVVLNLAVNARDAMPGGGDLEIIAFTVEAEDSLIESKPGNYVCLVVKDTGTGMNAATQERIFEPFYTTKATGKGTGLGLSTSYGAVKQLGGTIQIESELGKGTSIRVYLPLYCGTASTKAQVDTALTSTPGGETILVIEDDASIRQLAERILRERGYKVIAAEDGISALKLFYQNRGSVSLIFSDIVLPKGNGVDLANEIRRVSPATGILLTTGYTDRDIDSGKSDYQVLRKPYTPAGLAERVRSCLDEQRATRMR